MLGFAKMVEEKGFHLDSLKTEYTVIKDNCDNSSSENISLDHELATEDSKYQRQRAVQLEVF